MTRSIGVKRADNDGTESMPDISDFKLRGNRIDFRIDGEKFTAKYPEEYDLGREYLDLAKEFALALWANKVAFVGPEDSHIDFEVADGSLRYWLWIAQKVHELDCYQSLSDDFDSDEKELWDIREEIQVTTGNDPIGLVEPPVLELEEDDLEGAMISQSPGKESVASKLICDENGIGPINSVFIEYSSRATTHKIDGRKEYKKHFDNNTIRIWSNFNELQSTLQEYTDNYEPITCFWEMAYITMELPLLAYHQNKYLLVGNQLNTGEAMVDPKGRFTTFEELNQAYVFELALTDYLNEVHGLPFVHTSNVRPFTGYACRKLIGKHKPEFLENMQNCLRPNSKRRWCLKCYKCADAYIEFMGCDLNPAKAGLDHDVLVENPHLGAKDTEDWGFSFPRYGRNEQIWVDDKAEQFFNENVKSNLTDEQLEAFGRWRNRQEERVSQENVDHLRKFNGKYVEVVDEVIPDELLNDMGLPHGQFVEELLDVRTYRHHSEDWKNVR